MRRPNKEHLKYYLRGMGSGIILAALLLGAAGRMRESETVMLTDAQIRERALAMGMVEVNTLGDLRRASVSEGDGSTYTEADEASAEAGEAPTAEAEGASEVQEEALAETEEPLAETEEPRGVPVTVKKGDTSTRVARRLEEQGLIEDVKAFDTFLYEGGYDRRLMVGTYEIQPGAEWEEIARILTRDAEQ